MVDIGLRIKELRDKENLTQIEFCNSIGIKQSNLSHIENNGSKISVDVIRKIISKYDINAEWLITGQGAMLKTAQPETTAQPEILKAAQPAAGDMSAWCVDYLKEKDLRIEELNREIGALKEKVDTIIRINQSNVKICAQCSKNMGKGHDDYDDLHRLKPMYKFKPTPEDEFNILKNSTLHGGGGGVMNENTDIKDSIPQEPSQE